MGNIMENVKKAQQLVQVEAAKAQEELAAYVASKQPAHVHTCRPVHCAVKAHMFYPMSSN